MLCVGFACNGNMIYVNEYEKLLLTNNYKDRRTKKNWTQQ